MLTYLSLTLLCTVARLEPGTNTCATSSGLLRPATGAAVVGAARVELGRCIVDFPPVPAGVWDLVADGRRVPLCHAGGPVRVIAPLDAGALFADGFESGDTGRWR